MLIRSQDKMILVDAKRITINSVLYASKERYQIINLNSCVDNEIKDQDFLGEYATEERALEVLDEIQEHICRIDWDEHVDPVYEMPEN